MLSALCELIYLISTTNLQGRYYSHHYLIDQEIETEKLSDLPKTTQLERRGRIRTQATGP